MKKTGESVPSNEQQLPQPSHLFRMRANKRSSKSAALFDEDVLSPEMDKENVSAQLLDALGRVPGNRPVAEVVERSPGGRPSEVLTPNGTKLFRKKALGFFLSFTTAEVMASLNIPELLADHIAIDEIDIDEIESTLVPAGPDGFVKMQELVVTPELLAEAEQARKNGEKRGTNGIPDQAATMAEEGVNAKLASANHIAVLLKLQPTGLSLFEWLHLIMFFLLRLLAQDPNNLSGGTRAANTDMMMAENLLTRSVTLLKESVKLKVESLEMGFHFARKIRFTIVTKHFSLPFVFDALTTLPPSLEDHDYLQTFLNTLIAAKTLLTPPCAKTLFPSSRPAAVPRMPLAFFKRPKPSDSKPDPIVLPIMSPLLV